jgi:hypothetical protein
MSLRLIYSAVTGQFQQAMLDITKPIATAATATIKQAANQIKVKGRARIASAGFSSKWQNAFRVEVFPQHGVSMHPAALAHHNIPYAGIFAKGGSIAGTPLLWIPVSNAPTKIAGRRMTPRNYIQLVGPLHSLVVPGKPPMLAAYMKGRRGSKLTLSKLRAGAALARLGVRKSKSDLGGMGVVSVILFVGVSSVRIRQRFGLNDVFREAVAGLGSGYLANLRKING